MNEWMNEEPWMRGQQTCPLTIHFNMNTKLGRQHTKAPLEASLSPFMSFLYPPNPWCEWCDEWRLTTTPGSTSPTLFEQWCGFFYVPQKPDKCKCCETGRTVFPPYPRILESLTVCGWYITKAPLSSQLFKDPQCWSGRGSNPWRTSRPALSQLN